jgi:predicted nucleic acid-binding protein
MRLIDTSAWIEWVVGSPVGLKVAPLLPPDDEWLVPTIVQFELAKWAARLVDDPDQGVDVLAYSRLCQVVPLTTAIALEAAQVGRERRLAVADAIIYATAQTFDADLISCDAHFEGLPGVIYLPKRPN